MNIKQLKIKNIDVYSMVFSGIIYFSLGLLFLIRKDTILFAVKGLLDLLVILFSITAFFQIIGFTPLRKKRLTSISRILGFLINLLMALIIQFRPELLVSIFPIFFGVYASFSGIIKILIYMQYKANKVEGRFFIAIGAIVLILLGVMIIVHPLASILPISNIIGAFFVAYGISFILEGLLDGLSVDTKNSFKRKIRISLPVFMVAFIPHKILMKINKSLETEDLNIEDLAVFKEDSTFDLEVLIHVAEKGLSAFGHVDIWFEDKVMTYGSYDEDTYKLGGAISDGVLMELPDKEKYIRFSQEFKDKTLFGFGLKLTEEQKLRVRTRIHEIKGDLYEWKPKSRLDEDEGIVAKKPHEDYASLVYDNLKGKFYKFIKGPFKTYFVMNTNCVLLADSVVGQAGIDLVKIQGLISPGAYFEYFNKELSRKNSFVISRTIYYSDKEEKED